LAGLAFPQEGSRHPAADRNLFPVPVFALVLLAALLSRLTALLARLAAALALLLLVLAFVPLALLGLTLLAALALLILITHTALLIAFVLVGHLECSLGNAPGKQRWNKGCCSGRGRVTEPPREPHEDFTHPP
jgi:hypothetical protein